MISLAKGLDIKPLSWTSNQMLNFLESSKVFSGSTYKKEKEKDNKYLTNKKASIFNNNLKINIRIY